MSRILAVYEREMPTVSALRVEFHELFDETAVVFDIKKNIEVSPHDLQQVDSLILIRANNYLSMKLAEIAKKEGIFVISFLDDDLLGLPKLEPRMPWRMKQLRKILQMSNMILTSNIYIAQKYKKYTSEKRYAIVNTVISKKDILDCPESFSNNERIKIVYAAGRNHEDVFYKYIEPILLEIDHIVGEKISLSFIGVRPTIDTSKYSFPIKYHSFLPFLEYRKFMLKNHYDIGIAPLEDDIFCACKYFNKYIEYTLVGAFGIYSNVKPYTFIIRDGFNGLLPDNTSKAWLNSILQAVQNRELREKCYQNAKRQLSEEFTVEKIRKKLLEDIPELLSPIIKSSKIRSLLIAKVIYKIYRILDGIYLFLFYLRKGGIKMVLDKILYHIKH